MKYSMEAEIEASRLEKQVSQRNYSIADELSHFGFNGEEVVLDAGCGSGVLSRYLVNHYSVKHVDAVDYSDLRLSQAAELCTGKTKDSITFFQQDLEHLDPKFYGKYDTVVCRYVLEHCHNPTSVLAQAYKALRPGGRVIIFELDGAFFNLYSQNKKLNEYMEVFRSRLQIDLFIGRKLPAMLSEVGFSSIKWDAEILACKDERLTEELENMQMRFISIASHFSDVLGSREACADFQRLYLEEMMKPQNTLVFTKFICSGKKK